MRLGLRRLKFRTKVVLLAALLVTGIQLGTLVPVLSSIRQQQEVQAERATNLAGGSFDEFMQNRMTSLTQVANVLVADSPFREAVFWGGASEIENVLRNHIERAGSSVAAVFDLSGQYLGGISEGSRLVAGDVLAHFASDPGTTEPYHSIAYIDGKPYQTVSVPVREAQSAPFAAAWATLGFPINADLATAISDLTGLEATFVSFAVGTTEQYATTVAPELWESALAGLHLGNADSAGESLWGGEFITHLHPFMAEREGLYVALQLHVAEAMRPYFSLRDGLLILTAVALAATIAAAAWLSHMVTSPVNRLVEAAGRMREGIYSQPIQVGSQDEFAVLAAGFNSMQEAIANREHDIVHMAHHDSLSGLPTRELVVGELRDSIAETDQLAVINFVLHRFDAIASSLGHRTADRLIQLIAGKLRERLKEGQILGHLNLQEFVLVVPEADRSRAERIVHEIQSMMRAGVSVSNANISLQIRAGISLYPDHGVNASELLRCAGIARGNATHHLGAFGLYESGQEDASLESIQIVGDFPRALQDRQLWVEFQPKLACDSLELTGAEALVRWDHPELGRLPPDKFIGAIEQAGGISQLTRWVLEEAAATLADWRAKGLSMSMAANISAQDLRDDYLPDHLGQICQRHEIEPGDFTLEVTESSIMHDVESSLAVISRIREMGFRVAIDDFGTGHSALAQLKRLPVDELKIDKSFVMHIDDQRDEAVCRTAIELAHQFGLSVVAEGVENEESLVRLQALGCETVQGFHFSGSLKSEDFVAWARSWAAGEGADIVALVESGDETRRARR